ncbi:transposase family protein [Xanthocytophaga flava]|uniref:transposase family protein n=1 Tax=Xanthocytophaga flava TaxID=3048013 RepID=UPI0028D48676|nr:transposase family protein [Xanthocytophaga flavus]MDJ1469467.1 transposase family protein [Xanthocytophaga flavus]
MPQTYPIYQLGYQGRKAAKTTNILFVSDSQGVMLAMSTPQEGQHHDLFQIQLLFEQICFLLKQASINLEGLFLNADPAFDSVEFYFACQKQEIIANVKPNPRSSMRQNAGTENKQTGTYIYDDKLCREMSCIEIGL